MSVILKTNRLGIIKVLLPFFIVLSFFFVVLIGCYIFAYDAVKDQTFALVTLSGLEGIFVVGFLCAKFIRRRTYKFTENKISELKKGKQIEEIDIDNILSMKYKKFQFRYIFSIFFGELQAEGYWKLYLYMTNGNRITLDLFDIEDVKKLKNLYGDKIQII